VFLAVVIDRYSRKAIGWALDRSLTARVAVTALQQAIGQRQPPPGVVHHSDQGTQYASAEYAAVLQASRMVPSMSRPANPYDKDYASYCTSCGPCVMFSGKRRRSESLIPCALRGGSGPGSSYSHMFLSLTG
jgi:putative transposase